MTRTNSRQTATVSLLFATMIIIEILSQVIFQTFPIPIKPTITFVPVIIGSIIFGPKIGASLGLGMGIMSVIRNSLIMGPSSYLFSPLAPGGSWMSLIIAIAPRVLIGIIPYFVYKLLKNQLGIALAGASGAITNTLFVLGGAFFLFPHFLNGDGQAFIKLVLSWLSLIELVIATSLTSLIVPRLLHLKK